MSRTHFFLLCLQTVVLKSPMGGSDAVGLLQEGAMLAEDALPERLDRAALEFFRWVHVLGKNPAKKPEWLRDWDEAQANVVVVRRNHERDAREFYANLMLAVHEVQSQDDGAKWLEPHLLMMFGDVPSAEMTRETALRFKEFVLSVPGGAEDTFLYEKRTP